MRRVIGDPREYTYKYIIVKYTRGILLSGDNARLTMTDLSLQFTHLEMMYTCTVIFYLTMYVCLSMSYESDVNK